jgi:hypothetical protein
MSPNAKRRTFIKIPNYRSLNGYINDKSSVYGLVIGCMVWGLTYRPWPDTHASALQIKNLIL